MNQVTWTDAEYAEFVRLVEMSESRSQIERIRSRVDFPDFIKKHTKEKCDAMFAHLTAGDKK